MNLYNIARSIGNFFSPEKVEWGFMIIADRSSDNILTDADGNDDNELVNRITDLIKTASSFRERNKIQLVFCLKANKDFKNAVLDKLDLQHTGITTLGNVDPDKLLIFESNANTIRFEEHDITAAQGISNIFKKYYTEKIDAKYNGLITWGHGGVYSFFPSDDKQKIEKYSLQKYKMIGDKDDYKNYYWIKKYTDDLASDNYLNMGELKAGIQDGFGVKANRKHWKKLDIVIMSHCNMAYYETANMMSFCSKLWIAAPGFIQFNALDFSKKLNDLHLNNGETQPLAFAKNILKKDNGINRVETFIIYDLSKYYIVRKILYYLAGGLLSELAHSKNVCALKKIRDSCANVEATHDYHVVDLFNLCDKIIEHKQSNDRGLINEHIYSLANQIGNHIKSITLPVFEGEEEQGLMIHFPDSSYLVDEPADRLGNIPYKNHRKKWEFFVFRYLEALAKKPCNQN